MGAPLPGLPAGAASFDNRHSMTNPAPQLELREVSRRAGGRELVHGLNLSLARGHTLGLLGVNGAGKTTSLRMIAGVLAPSSGQVLIDGADLHEEPQLAQRCIGYLPETPPLHVELSVREYLDFCARLHGVARGAVSAAVARAIERCDLGEVARRLLGNLSKGFRQRVGVAQAIVHEPGLIVLDEPASGLDPVQALRLRELIRSLGREHALILSTHVLPDVVACCDEVAILHRGRIRHVGAVQTSESALVQIRSIGAVDAAKWSRVPQVVEAHALDHEHWHLRLRDEAQRADLPAALLAAGIRFSELRSATPSLESTFLEIAGGDVAEAA